MDTKINHVSPVQGAGESFGARLKAARGDLSQERFAERLGVQLASLRNWEQGRRCPKRYTQVALLRAASGRNGSKASGKKMSKIHVAKNTPLA